VPQPFFTRRLCSNALKMQLSLLVFNLLSPAYPLDGGRIVVDLMSMRGVALERAARITAALSFATGSGICIYALAVASWFTLPVGVWVVMQAWELAQKVRGARAAAGGGMRAAPAKLRLMPARRAGEARRGAAAPHVLPLRGAAGAGWSAKRRAAGVMKRGVVCVRARANTLACVLYIWMLCLRGAWAAAELHVVSACAHAGATRGDPSIEGGDTDEGG
jgi:hypothetical protein